jgi:hypothetical protein
VKNLTWQNPGQLFVAQELIKIVKLKCCGIKDLQKHITSAPKHKILLRPNLPKVQGKVSQISCLCTILGAFWAEKIHRTDTISVYDTTMP